MTREIIHSLILTVAVALTFLFPKTFLVNYDLQIAAGLFICLFIAKRFLVPKYSSGRLIESVVFTLVVLTIVNTTGGAASPFFFLIFFLLFSLSLILEPMVSIAITLSLIVFFLFTLSPDSSLKILLPIFSLAFLTPFAMFMGQEYLETQNLKLKTQNLQKDTFLFLSLMLKNQLKNIKNAAENFMGDHQLDIIRKSVRRIEKLIEQYEKSN